MTETERRLARATPGREHWVDVVPHRPGVRIHDVDAFASHLVISSRVDGLERLTVRRLADEYPGTAKELCALEHDNPYQLLVATILSAQSTDETVNKVTPPLFARYPTPADLAHANPDDVEELIHASGFFRSKTRSLIGMAQGVEERFGGGGRERAHATGREVGHR